MIFALKCTRKDVAAQEAFDSRQLIIPDAYVVITQRLALAHAHQFTAQITRFSLLDSLDTVQMLNNHC